VGKSNDKKIIKGKKMKVLVLVGMCLLLTSCNLFKDTFIVHQDRVATKIEADGAFVTVGEFMQLADGESVKFSNPYKLETYYYIPKTYIVRTGDMIRLRKEEDDKVKE